MISGTPAVVSTAEQGAIAEISAFMRQCTFEATRPGPKDIEALRTTLAPGSTVYLTMLPNQPQNEALTSSIAIRKAGLEPVPHITAREQGSLQDVDELLASLNEEAGVTRVFLIGGDRATPKGSVRDVLSIIESGVLQRNRIRQVGFGGFPDGHPVLTEEELEASLVTKLAAAQSGSLEAHIVTQFSFDASAVIKWLGWLRQRGIHVPVQIGMAGPTSLMTWLNFARKCGVKASAEALVNQSGLVKRAFKAVSPDPMIRQLASVVSDGSLGRVAPHLFAFGGIGATAKWAQPAIRGDIRLNSDGGFNPAPGEV